MYDLKNKSIPDLEQEYAQTKKLIKDVEKVRDEYTFKAKLISVEIFTRQTGIKVGTIMRNTQSNQSCVVVHIVGNTYGGHPDLFIRKVKNNGEYYAMGQRLYRSDQSIWKPTGYDPQVEKMVELEKQERKKHGIA